MKSKMKNVLLMGLSLVLVAALAIGGTVAYLTDTDSAVNVMTAGNVNVELNEKQRDDNGKLEDFEQGKTLNPIVGNITEKDEIGMPTNSNYVDKIVYATNTGKNDAYIRILVAIPAWANTSDDTGANANNLHWNYPNDTNMAKLQDAIGGDFSADSYKDWTLEYDATLETTIEIDGAAYGVYSFTMNDVVKAGESTPVVMTGCYLDSAVDYDADKGVYLDKNGNEIEGFDGTVYIPVFVQAVQADGFADADTALDTAFGEFTPEYNPWEETKVPAIVSDAESLSTALTNGEDAVLADNVSATSPVVLNGNTLNGGGNTLDSDYVGTSGWGQYAIVANSGTVENITIVDAFRGIGSVNTSDDVYIKNVTIDNVTYAINGNGTDTQNVYVSDSTIYGWISYADVASINFADCTIGKGNSNDGYMVIYGTTNFTNCEFETGFAMCGDLRGNLGSAVTFTNCTYNGEKVTAENFKTLFKYPGDDIDFNKLSNYEIVIDGVTVAW